MNFNNNIPIYLQIINKIKQDIVKEVYHSGDKLSSVREMAIAMQVNPNTIQRVYQELDRQGITFTRRGMGTYITDDERKIGEIRQQVAENIFKKFIHTARKAGYTDAAILGQVKKYLKEEE